MGAIQNLLEKVPRPGLGIAMQKEGGEGGVGDQARQHDFLGLFINGLIDEFQQHLGAEFMDSQRGDVGDELHGQTTEHGGWGGGGVGVHEPRHKERAVGMGDKRRRMLDQACRHHGLLRR